MPCFYNYPPFYSIFPVGHLTVIYLKPRISEIKGIVSLQRKLFLPSSPSVSNSVVLRIPALESFITDLHFPICECSHFLSEQNLQGTVPHRYYSSLTKSCLVPMLICLNSPTIEEQVLYLSHETYLQEVKLFSPLGVSTTVLIMHFKTFVLTFNKLSSMYILSCKN